MKPELTAALVETYSRHAQERANKELADWKLEERACFVTFLKEQHKKTLLEIGAGAGKDSQFFQQNGFNVVCTDRTPAMVSFCHQKNLAAAVMDFCYPAFPRESFEAVWALNCLVHTPKQDMPVVLQSIKAVLKPKGLFYLGMWGGDEYEGIWENDSYTPKRFFSFYSDQHLQAIVTDFFELLYFKPITLENRGLRFLSMILRKQ